MDERERAALREQLKPLAEELSKLFIDSLCLRIEYHLLIAKDAGAEDEDVPGIIDNAMESAKEIVLAAVNQLSEHERATDWANKIGGD